MKDCYRSRAIRVAQKTVRTIAAARVFSQHAFLLFRFGTLEELMEVATWTQLGHHQKAVGILNINGFYDHLLTFIRTCESEVLPVHASAQ